MLKRNYILILIFIMGAYKAQLISPSVINTAGKTTTLSSGGTYNDNVGEVFVTSLATTNSIITQGFLQPESNSGLGVFNVSMQPVISQLTCNRNDGRISLNASTSGAYKIFYVWTPNSVCPDSSCATLDSLKPGNYVVTIKARFSRPPKPDTVVVLTSSVISILDNNNPCLVSPYNAITLNGDGQNDFFYIENIDAFPENSVSIYNRYGILIKAINGYNNSDRVWPDRDNNARLLGGTYFYVIRLTDKESLIKGWVELIK
jgi:gliding motility-associated-like protein